MNSWSKLFQILESFCIFFVLEKACQCLSDQFSLQSQLCTFQCEEFLHVSFPTPRQLHLSLFFEFGLYLTLNL